MDLIKRKQNNILLHRVNIGEKTISIPVAQLGKEFGKTVLITAGLDGDEYAGIEAAYALIEFYAKQQFEGRLIIIPLVNIPGFEAAVSWNPLDNKYPKHIFPGKEKGSSTDRLMYWLSENFVRNVDIWIDLHSGASTETLDPFVWFWKTKQKQVNEQVFEKIHQIKTERIIFQHDQDTYVENIAKRKTAYVLFESGQRGERDKRDIKQHIDWVKQLLDEKNIVKPTKKIVYKAVKEFVAEKEGIWMPVYQGKTVQKSKVLGDVRSLDGKIVQKIIAKENGVFLWKREAMFCKKGDSLYAYAHTKEKITT